MSPVEKMARAYYEATHDMRVDIPWSECHIKYREQRTRAMGAALLALSDAVSEEMVEAGARAMCERTGADPNESDAVSDENGKWVQIKMWQHWEPMARSAITAALKAAGGE